MNEQAEIFAFLRDLLVDMTDHTDDMIKPESELESLELDSLDYVQIQVEVQKTYKVQVPTEKIANGEITTLGQMAEMICEAA
jgi:acyl carrier protein